MFEHETLHFFFWPRRINARNILQNSLPCLCLNVLTHVARYAANTKITVLIFRVRFCDFLFSSLSRAEQIRCSGAEYQLPRDSTKNRLIGTLFCQCQLGRFIKRIIHCTRCITFKGRYSNGPVYTTRLILPERRRRRLRVPVARRRSRTGLPKYYLFPESRNVVYQAVLR